MLEQYLSLYWLKLLPTHTYRTRHKNFWIVKGWTDFIITLTLEITPVSPSRVVMSTIIVYLASASVISNSLLTEVLHVFNTSERPTKSPCIMIPGHAQQYPKINIANGNPWMTSLFYPVNNCSLMDDWSVLSNSAHSEKYTGRCHMIQALVPNKVVQLLRTILFRFTEIMAIGFLSERFLAYMRWIHLRHIPRIISPT